MASELLTNHIDYDCHLHKVLLFFVFEGFVQSIYLFWLVKLNSRKIIDPDINSLSFFSA